MTLLAPASRSHEPGSNKNPLSFGDDQTIVDLDKIIWAPLEVEGLAPGAEIAVIRGALSSDHSESLLAALRHQVLTLLAERGARQ